MKLVIIDEGTEAVGQVARVLKYVSETPHVSEIVFVTEAQTLWTETFTAYGAKVIKNNERCKARLQDFC